VRRFNSALFALLTVTAQARAQQDTLSRALVRRSEALTLLGFGVAAAAIAPADEHLAAWIRGPSVQGPSLNTVARVFNFAGDPGTVIASATLYVFGAATHRRHAMDAAVHIGESVVGASVITWALKTVAGRARPFVSADTNSKDLRFGRGRDGGQYQSLPSGHTTAAFAFASAMASEAATWTPRWHWVAPAGYGAATLVALARMYDDKHWASDVVLAAGIGTATAKATVRFNHARPGNRIDRLFIPSEGGAFHISVSPSANGRTRVGVARAW
jgi:membrane-associated phospholipid phosphatase